MYVSLAAELITSHTSPSFPVSFLCSGVTCHALTDQLVTFLLAVQPSQMNKA